LTNKPELTLPYAPSEPSWEIPWKTIETSGLNKLDSSETTAINPYNLPLPIWISLTSKREKLKWKKKKPYKESKDPEAVVMFKRTWKLFPA